MIETLPQPYGDCQVVRWAPGRAMDWHQHDYVQLIHVLEGQLEVDWGDGWILVPAGALHILPPRCRHRLRSPRGQRQFGLNFRAQDATRDIVAAVLARSPSPSVHPCSIDAEHLTEVLSDPRGLGPDGRLRRGMALDGYVQRVLDGLDQATAGSVADRLLVFLHRHRATVVSVATCATALGTSRVGIQRVCHHHFGCGVGRLHERLRLDRAARLLLANDDAVAAIADRCGYPDIYAFSRAFKRVHALSPRAFRQQRLEA